MKRELARKAIHVSSTAVPLLVWLLPRPIAIGVLVPVAVLALGIDLARHWIRPFRYHFLRHTRTMLRHHERHGVAGATWMAVAYAAAVVLFPTPIAVAAMLFNGLGDAAAALVGKRWDGGGRRGARAGRGSPPGWRWTRWWRRGCGCSRRAPFRWRPRCSVRL